MEFNRKVSDPNTNTVREEQITVSWIAHKAKVAILTPLLVIINIRARLHSE